jgi:uncharacterized membrane protein YhaH (DUF805 family)
VPKVPRGTRPDHYFLPMEIVGLPWHTVLAYAAAGLGPIGCLTAFWYAVRVERRDFWRWPMLITATFATAAILGAYITGDQLLNDQPNLAADADVASHQEYATRLVLPTIGFWVMATLTGWLNPRTGILRLALPFLLAGFAIVVLILVVLSGDADARSLWDNIRQEFTG